MTPYRLAAALAAVTLVAGTCAAQGKPWTGMNVLCIKFDEGVEFGLRFDGKYVVFPFNSHGFVKVREDREGRIRFHDGRNEGWANKSDFSLCCDAPAHYTRRIEADPTDAVSLYFRGLAYAENRDYPRAIADFDAYLKLHPEMVSVLLVRGDTWGRAGDRGRAIRDYDEVLRLDPANVSAFHYRGCEWRASKEYGRALKDFDVAVRLDPDRVAGRFSRAVTQMLMRRRASLKGFRAVLDAPDPDPEVTPFAVIFGHLAARQVGDDEAARRFLEHPAGDADAGWPRPAVQFLRGEIDEPTLLALADDDDKRTEARCFLGMDHALRGRPAEARPHFEWVKGHGNPAFTEFVVALAELDRLDAPPKGRKP